MLETVFRDYRKTVWALLFTALVISNGRVDAEVGFRRVTQWERLVDPTRFAKTYGLASALRDSSAKDSSSADTIQVEKLSPAPEGSVPKIEELPLEQMPPIEPDQIFPSDSEKPSAGEPRPSMEDAEAEDSELDKTGKHKEAVREKKEGKEEPLPYRPTQVFRIDLPIELSVEHDEETGYILLNQQLSGSKLPVPGAMTEKQYLDRTLASSDRESWRKTVLNRLPTKDKEKGGGISISIPVFRSKRAQRIFGGSNIGLSVSGNIKVDGSMKVQKKEEQQRDNPNPTSYQFNVNQSQQFAISGKVGEKVSVDIDQDSEKLFEFENNLKVRYTGYEDEIIQSIQAGNVDLALRGTKLASASASNKGLFGFKTVSKLGRLELTTIASLEKGEKDQLTLESGAQSERPIKIQPNDYTVGRYFFLNEPYREQYKYRQQDMMPIALPPDNVITEIDVYVSISAGQEDIFQAIPGWALFDPTESVDDNTESDPEHQRANFRRLTQDLDYTVNTQRGFIRLNQNLDYRSSILAVAYRTPGAVYGDQEFVDSDTTNFVLKLLKPANPQPSDSTWNLMWRNVYYLGAINIDKDGFEGKITGMTTTDGVTQRSEETIDTLGSLRTFIDLFGIDFFNAGGGGEADGLIDDIFINYAYGELIFPDLHPFAPEGWYKVIQGSVIPQFTALPDTLFNPDLYTKSGSELARVRSDFEIEARYKSVKASYTLGFNVLEGSEEVFLNGALLSRGSGYTIDYLTGELKILDPRAQSAGAHVEIKYEKGQLFQLDTKTLFGVRAEYELWENSFIGTTFLYMNQKTLDQRVRVGGEPLRNSIWDVNAQLSFKPYFLTRAADWLPLIETDEPSKFTVNGEVAQVYPNPNSLNSPSTQDYNGVAYIDDFESVKRTTPLGITRLQWTRASFPLSDSRGEGLWKKQRGRLIWYNPWEQAKTSDIWENREDQAQESTVPVLKIEFQPWWEEWGADKREDDTTDPTKSWGGIMRYLGTGYADQSQSKYLEIWLRRGSAGMGSMYIDLGKISEDAIPDNKLNTEDREIGGRGFGNGVLDEGEDVGLDGMAGSDDSEFGYDSTQVNEIGKWQRSYDDWNYNPQVNRNDYSHINNTEGNGTGSSIDQDGRYPDTEDISGNNFLDLTNSFYRYQIDLSKADHRYIVGGKSNTSGWRLYRIPLTDTLEINSPSNTSIEYVRLWFSGLEQRSWLEIAQIDIVGNEWREIEIEDERIGNFEPLKVAVVNTFDNADYIPPDGVAGEVDPATDFQTQEQSLVLKIQRLRTGEEGIVERDLPRQNMDLLEYRTLKMYVSGRCQGGIDKWVDRFDRKLDLEIFLRFGDGTGNSKRYYEYSQQLHPGWSPENEIIIDFDRLASLKFLRQQSGKDTLRDYDILPNGDVIRVVGDPNLSEIGFYAIGIKNHGSDITAEDNIEVWVDELRVSDIHRDPGWAATGSFDLEIADVLDISGSMTQRQADFHNVNDRKGSREDKLEGRASVSFKLDKLFNPNWKLNLPLEANISQSINIPKYQPHSDIELSSLTGESVDMWPIFMDNLWDNSRLADNPPDQSPVDSMITAKKSYGLSMNNIKKQSRSSNPFIRYSVDNISMGGSFSETWGSSPNYQYNYDRTIKGNTGYSLSFENPWEVRWLGWAGSVPLVKKMKESMFRPLPSSLGFSANGTETEEFDKSRKGSIKQRYRMTVNRGMRVGWRPLSVLSFDLSQDISSARDPDDGNRTRIARESSELDSTTYWSQDTTGAGVFDSAAWENDITADVERLKKLFFWEAFRSHFIDDNLSQSFSVRYSPAVISWLGSDFNYTARYLWNWRDGYNPGGRSVTSRGTFTSNITLKLPQIMSMLERVGGGGKTGDEGLPAPGSGGLPVPGRKFGSGFGLPENVSPPVPDGGSSGTESDQPPGSEDTSPKPEEDTDDKGTFGDAKADTVVVEKKKRRNVQNPLAPITGLLKRLRDIRWDYTLGSDLRNNTVIHGQASWNYRLGLTKDPGLRKVSGYITTDTYSRTDEHRFSSGLNITQNLSVSSFDYTHRQSLNQSISQYPTENGSTGKTAWYMFEDDNVTVKAIPAVNWSIRWAGWERLPVFSKIANSVSLDNVFRGSESERWRSTADSARSRETLGIDYEKNFSPLLGVSFNWKGGVGTNVSYNLTQTISDDKMSGTKNKSLSRTIRLSASYNLRKGFRIPIPIWPFNNKRFKNNTSFSLAYNNTFNHREISVNDQPFETTSESGSWSLSPSLEYTFSTSVRGSFGYEYAVQRSDLTGKTTSQDMRFSVNISIRG